MEKPQNTQSSSNQNHIALNTNYRAKDVMQLFQIGQSTLYDHIKKGLLPAPLKLGRTSIWLREEIDEVLERMKAERDAA